MSSSAIARHAAGVGAADRAAPRALRWAVAAPFTLDPATDRWLVPFVPAGRHAFTLVAARSERSWHQRAGRGAGWTEWLAAWNQSAAACREDCDGVITVFPRLALAVGLRRRIERVHRPVVAWCFNLGALYPGLRGRVARTALARVDRFIVHSRAEVARYAHWLDLPEERVRFVHLQREHIPVVEPEDEHLPFVLALGSARRDYATFFEAVRRARLPTLVVAARHALEGLAIPDNVQVQHSLSAAQCRILAQRARVNVVPVCNDETASGQVTLVEAMRMGRAVVATRGIGSEDYVDTESTGLLVPPRSVEELQRAIERLWHDGGLRRRLGANAARFTAERCSDQAAGAALARVLDELAEARGAAPVPREGS